MADLWYYTNEGVQMDAVTIKELKRLVGDGSLKPTDMVWQEGMPRWIRASSVGELFPDPTAALDHYFTNTGGKTAPVGETKPQTTSVKPVHVPTASAAGTSKADAKGQSKPSSEDTERRKPPRRRADPAATGGGMNWGILIAIFIGAFVLLAGLVVGIVILIVVSRTPDGGNERKDGFVQAKDAGVKVNPKVGAQTVYTVSIGPQQANSREFTFEAGATYEIVVKSQPRNPDVDIYVLNPGNNAIEVFDNSIGPDSFVRWSPNRTGAYRIDLRNLDAVTQAQSTVTLRMVAPSPKQEEKKDDKKDAKKDPLDEPLPPDTFEKRGSKQLALLPGREISFKFRVKAGHKASFNMTTIMAVNAKVGLIVAKESDTKAVLAEDKDTGANPRVQLDLPNTEIVRVRIINQGTSSIRGNLSYDVSP